MTLALVAPPEPYSGLIFDCDGTLADTMPNHYKAWVAALAVYGAEFPEKRFYEMGGMPTEAIIRALNDEYGYTLEVHQTHIEKEHFYVDMLHSVEEIKAIVDIARANFGKVPMAVASGGIRSVVEKTLAVLHISDLFQAVVTADDVTHGKPAPDVFLLAAERLGVPPAECVVYEDGDVGVVAAERAGMRCVDVRVLWGNRGMRPNPQPLPS